MADVPSPFIVFALPRSRTFWLSRFLHYGGWTCTHDEARHVRGLDDIRSWFDQQYVGTVETAAAPFWRLVTNIRPDTRVVVVRRPVAEVVDSLMALGISFDRSVLTAHLTKLDRKLAQIERKVPGVLSVSFAELADEQACARVFEHCLPFPHDHAWWQSLSAFNLQTSVPATLRYATAYRRQMDVAVKHAVAVIRQNCLRRQGTPEPAEDGVVICEEPFETFWRDGKTLMSEHCVAVGEPPDNYLRKNLRVWDKISQTGAAQIMTARLNGRMIGYLAAVLCPSLENDSLLSTQLSFYITPDARGLKLAMRMQRAAIERAKQRGCQKMYMRKGIRGSGDRIDLLYKRLGATDYGQLFELDLA